MATLFLKTFTKVSQGLWLSVVFLFTACLPLLYFSPIYTDEVAWKWLSARYFLDGGKTLSLYPQCVKEFGDYLPVLFYPSFRLYGFLYGALESLHILKMGSFVSISLIFILLTLVLGKIKKSVVIAPLLFGVLPFSFMLNRPEQVMLIGVLLAIYLSLKDWKTSASKALGFLGFILGAELFFSSHAKSLFFLPVFLACLHVSCFSKILKALGIVFVGFLGLSCFQYFSSLTQCQNPAILALLSKVMMAPDLILSDPWGAMIQAQTNLVSLGRYVTENVFKNRYPMEWLPENYGFSWGTSGINWLIGIFWISVLILVFVRGIRFKGKVKWLFRALLLSLFTLGILQSSKSFYEGPLVLTLLWLCGSISLSSSDWQRLKVPARILACLSLALLSYRFYPVLRNSWSAPGPLPNQNHSVKIAYSKEIKSRVKALSERCNVKTDESVWHLVVDDLTYPYFWQTKEPYHAVYVTGWWGRESIPDFQKFFEEKQVAGYLAQCHWLAPELRRKALRDKELCCLRSFS